VRIATGRRDSWPDGVGDGGDGRLTSFVLEQTLLQELELTFS